MKTTHQLAAAAALCCTLAGVAQATAVPAGTLITGSASGAASGLLGLDAGFADVPGTQVTALAAAELEFLSSDFAVGIDFGTDGSITFFNNTGLAELAGSYSFSFDFDALPAAISGFALADLSGLSGGALSAAVLNSHAISISLNELRFASAFGSFTAQITTTVPEPTTLALLAGSLALLWATRARRQEG
jgi:hypothetical protein